MTGLGSGVWGHIRVTALLSLCSQQFQDSTHKISTIYTEVTNSSHIRTTDRLPNLITSEEITLADVPDTNGELNPLINFPLRMCD